MRCALQGGLLPIQRGQFRDYFLSGLNARKIFVSLALSNF